MFPYDAALAAAVQTPPQTIDGVLQTMRAIDATCADADGLKWFNGLYLQVTEAVAARVAAGTFADSAWIANLDVQFALLYFSALQAQLSEAPCPACWRVLFDCRNNPAIARIQFALAGINAHINYNLSAAIVVTCQATHTVPQQETQQYNDYTSLNPTLSGIIDTAKQTLQVRLPGDPLPAVSHLENIIAAWDVGAARDAAWTNGELLWHLRDVPALSSRFLDTLDGSVTVIGKTLLVPVP